MISMLLVLFTVVSVINILNFCGIVDDADFILSVLASNDGTFPVIEKGNSGADRNEFESMPDNNIPKKNQSDIIVFLDCSNSLSTCKTFLFTSGIISFAGALAVFLLILIFSGRIVKPVSESYEKQKQFITDAGHEIKTPFGDLEAADWAKESIAKLYVKGVVSGDGENFYPNRSVTRAEFTKMLVNSLGLLKNDVKCEFGDISEDSWEYIYVASAVESGIVTGDENGNFNGGSEISREDMCVMLYRAWQVRNGGEYENSESFADESQISSYAKDAVYAMRAFGIINGVGDNNFAPKTTATRAMAAKVIAGFMEGMNL